MTDRSDEPWWVPRPKRAAASRCGTFAVHPAWVAPLDAAYRGCVVHAAPPPSEAFQYLLTLRILDGFDIVRHPRGSADHLDLV